MRAILTFHSVDPSGSVLSIAPRELRSLLEGVHASGHRIVSLRELRDVYEPKRVALSFDDGLASVASEALPILREFGATATLFLTTGHVGGENDWAGQPDFAPRFPMMTWDQVDELVLAGWEIQSHTVSHTDLRKLGDELLLAELTEANDAIERHVGKRPDSLAFPYGFTTDRVTATARKQNPFCFTTELAPVDRLGVRDIERGYPRLDAYYLRPPILQRCFGSIPFLSYIALRSFARRMREV